MTKNKRKQIARDNKRENTECIPHQYKIGDKVLRIIGVFEESTPNIKVILIRLLRCIQTVQLPSQGVKHRIISIRNIEPYFRNKFRIMSIVTSQIWGGDAVDVLIYVDFITNPGFYTCLMIR